MGFIKEKTRDYFLLDTSVENIFINEYMAGAPGDFVKVYLFALMYAGLGVELTNEDIAKNLSMEHEDVLKAWNHWEKMGAVRKVRRNPEDKFDWSSECSGSSFTARKSRSDRAYLTRTFSLSWRTRTYRTCSGRSKESQAA